VIEGDRVLLIRHRHHASGHSYWLLPGGGQEAGETPEECLRRELREETSLEVAVGEMLLDDPDMPGGSYQRLHTYLCRAIGGTARPGYEPEEEAAAEYAIVEVGWVDLRAPATWRLDVQTDPVTEPLLWRLRAALGYADQ
jgi:ADP-ribose pyrophosphatase YjhB (NUDIX family)